MLEECGLPYRVVPVNLATGEQFSDAFLAISPNNRMPAIVDSTEPGEPVSVFESGAILIYLAKKTGRFLPAEGSQYYDVLQWLFWQVGGLGPMAGQVSHFINYAPALDDQGDENDKPGCDSGEDRRDAGHAYSLRRYQNEYDRLLGVLDRRLRDRAFIAGDYSIADMAAWPWLLPYRHYGQDIEKFPHLLRWHQTMKARPAVQRGVDVGKEWRRSGGQIDEKTRKILFEQSSDSLPPDKR